MKSSTVPARPVCVDRGSLRQHCLCTHSVWLPDPGCADSLAVSESDARPGCPSATTSRIRNSKAGLESPRS
eukprot:399102-Rhodomonas_salina.1